jgi:hypothetical protein
MSAYQAYEEVLSMLSRSRLVILGAISTLLLATGCPAAKVKNPTSAGEGTVGSTIANEKIVSASIKGTVQLPSTMLSTDGTKLAYRAAAVTNNKPAIGAKVYVTDERLKQMPNTGVGTTSAQGKFTCKPIPANNVWFLKAEFNGLVAYSMVVPIAKKEVDVTINMASTLATAGIYPLFTDAARPKYNLDDMNYTLFLALVTAVDKALDNDSVPKPKKVLGDMTADFSKLMSPSLTGGAAVKKAYDDIVGDLKNKAELRRQGLTSKITKPENTVPGNEDAGSDDTTASPSPSPEESPTPKTYPPVVGTISQVELKDNADAPLTLNGTNRVQLLSVAGTFLVVPDDTKMLIFDAALKGRAVSTTPEGKTITDARAVTLVGNVVSGKVITLAKVEGAYHLLVTSAATQAPLPSVKLKGQAVTRLSYAAEFDSDHILAVDEGQAAIMKIKLSDGETTVFAGVAGQPGDSNTKLPANQFKFSQPTAIVKSGSDYIISDRDKHQIVKLTTADMMVEPIIGGTQGIASGALKEAKVESPSSLSLQDNELIIGANTSHCVQQATLDKDEVVSLTDNATARPDGANMVRLPAGVVHHGASVIILSEKKLIKFSPNL